MAGHARAIDYGSGETPPKLQGTGSARTPGAATADPIEEALHLLARAVQHLHTYPATSPLCRTALETCGRALALAVREQIGFRIEPSGLVVGEAVVGTGTLIEHELARRLHAAAIAQVTIEQAVSVRELTHFCADLLACSQRTAGELHLVELLAEHGVDRISVRAAYRPEVLDVRPPDAAAQHVLERQRAQRAQMLAGGGPVEHLYPPDKGWVRIDPAADVPTVSLVDLAVLAEDPAALAAMLLRLTDDGGGEAGDAPDALSEKFSDVTMLVSALDPRVARVMFAKLARAVLDLDVDRRQALLRRTILPGLLDGRIDGSVLRDFPDVDLAESLCLLLDLETAAPEVITTALARLDLSAEQRAAVIPLIAERLTERAGGPRGGSGLEAHARRLVRVDAEANRSFAEFSAFDLSLDGQARDTLGRIREAIARTDLLNDQLACVHNLVRLEANPELVERFAARADQLLCELEHARRWADCAGWLARFRQVEEGLRESRPDVADVLTAHRTNFCSVERARRLADLAGESDASRTIAGLMIEALGAPIGPALLTAIRGRTREARDRAGRAVVQLLCEHARVVAPALATAAGEGEVPTERIVARVLGLAGPGYEPALGRLLEGTDEPTVREALRSLARVGSSQAAAIVAAQIARRTAWAAAAEQTLWHFPVPETHRQLRQLLGKREFILRQPDMAGRLLERAAQTGMPALEPILQMAAPLKYRFWNFPVMRVGRKARALLAR